MNILLYRDGTAVDAILCPDGSTVSADRSTIVMPSGNTVTAPDGRSWYVAPEGGGIGWALDGTGVPCPPATDLAEVKARAIATLRSACDAVITAGFESSALGAVHVYPSAIVDQVNQAVAAAGGGDLWCAAGGLWSLVTHTAAEAAVVVTDLSAHRSSASMRLALLTAEIEGAADAAAVAAITWE